MSTIASPRPSVSTAPSNRTSLDTPVPGSAASLGPGSTNRAPSSSRRNRAALRDYYNLSSNGDKPAENEPSLPQEEIEHAELAELDKEGFDAEKYVGKVLEREGLEGVLRVEGALVSEIKGLDGQRKALVYDNYSKLIAATDTIKKMRMNMDPLTPTTSTLSPVISHIAETASSLSASLANNTVLHSPVDTKFSSQEDAKVQTVRWVLDSPRRLRTLVSEGNIEKARSEWLDITRLLDKWNDVQGVDEVRKACQESMATAEDDEDEESDS